MTYKVSNGSSESEAINVTIFVVPRPAAAGPARREPAAGLGARRRS